MATVMDTEKESLELETLPEYVREESPRAPEPKGFAPSKPQAQSVSLPILTAPSQPLQVQTAPPPEEYDYSPPSSVRYEEEVSEPKPQTDVLETLWPGVHHDFHTPTKRSPSFYLTIGFMVGGFIVLIAVWLFSAASSMVAGFNKPTGTIVQKGNITSSVQQTSSSNSMPTTLTPATSVYEVQTGDTLAGIALKNYKHVSPRLLDEICQSNNLGNANVLNLGQKIILPVYHPKYITAR